MPKRANSGSPQIRLRFVLPCAALAPYVTTFYHMEVANEGDEWIEDYLHPEWANIRFNKDAELEAAVGNDELREVPSFVATGATSFATRFRLRSGRFWGIGLLPLGWLKFVGVPARDYADRFCDAASDPAFSALGALQETLYSEKPNFQAEIGKIERHLLGLVQREVPDEDGLKAVHSTLVDPDIASVADFAAKAGMATRTLERFSSNMFGFPPKLLLRRQRFLRSLAQFMLDPSLSWLSTLDYQYHDQAHFVRDFRRFMGMSPSDYRQLPHPVLMAAAQGRAQAAGEAVQGLHDPE